MKNNECIIQYFPERVTQLWSGPFNHVEREKYIVKYPRKGMVEEIDFGTLKEALGFISEYVNLKK